MNTPFPTLDLIQIASPCEASWEDMRGNDRVRFCSHCQLNVYNLTDMSRAEAEKLAREREDRLCVRFFRRHDGTVLTRDCPVGLHTIRRRLIRSVAAVAGLLVAMIGGSAFGSRIGRWLPSGLRTPSQSLSQWVDPAPDPISCQSPAMMGKMVMGDVALPLPTPAPPVHTVPVGEAE
jgi:hypothetical protein